MRFLFNLLFIIPSFSFGQMIFESVLDQTIVVHSISNLEGNRYSIPLKLPSFTNGYIVRITVSQNNNQPQSKTSLIENILNLTSNVKGFVSGVVIAGQLIHPPTSEHIDLFIVDGSSNAENFENKTSFEYIYQSLGTVSTNFYMETLPNEGYLCLRNMNTLQGLVVHVEVAAEIGWGKNLKQKMFNIISEKIASENKYSSDQITDFCECFVNTISDKEITEVRNMLDSERNSWIEKIENKCRSKAGIKK